MTKTKNAKTKNEWQLLKLQFDALAREEAVNAESIEEIFDFEFRRRFAELLVETARHNSTSHYNWPRR
jgi:hypothetical protein